jgi:hypothetical protein
MPTAGMKCLIALRCWQAHLFTDPLKFFSLFLFIYLSVFRSPLGRPPLTPPKWRSHFPTVESIARKNAY